MHDANGTPLKKGDTVLIPAVITDLTARDGYCDASLDFVRGRHPDGMKVSIHAINTGVLVKVMSKEHAGVPNAGFIGELAK